MLVLLGGFLGSGRKVLARELARVHGLHLYDSDRHLVRRHVFDTKGRVQERKVHVRSDTERSRVFGNILSDFPMLSKMHEDVIVERPFHRKVPRDFFFSEARKYFDPIIFVWVDSDEESIRQRLVEMSEKKIIRSVENALQEREICKKDFEPFEQQPITFRHEGDIAASAERLWSVVQKATGNLT